MDKPEGYDCLVIPLFQHQKSGLTDCDDFLHFLVNQIPLKSIHLSSGYFNPALDLRWNSVLVPSEKANGFYEGSGLLKYVPKLYSAILKRLAREYPARECRLYNRPDWSFHAKGLWAESQDDVYIHVIGSSNFNWRSSVRDFETLFVLITNNRDLMQRINDERDLLWQDSILYQPQPSMVIYEAITRLIKSFL